MIYTLKKYQFHIYTTLVFTFLSNWLNVCFQAIIAFFLILSLGLIHGANDIQLIQKKTEKNVNFIFLRTILLYVLVVLAGIFLFFFLPKLGLTFFVAFSAFHFGEQHLESKIEINANYFHKFLLYFTYGISLFGLLFTLQWDEVHGIIWQIAGFFVTKQDMEFLFLFGLIPFLILGISSRQIRSILFAEVLMLFVIGLLFSRSSLIMSFGVYFVVWHSIPSIKDQLIFLYPNQQHSFLSYLRSSAPYWIFSLIGLLLVYFLFDITSDAFLPLFFSFLAAITFPHTVVMGWLKLSEKHSIPEQDKQT